MPKKRKVKIIYWDTTWELFWIWDLVYFRNKEVILTEQTTADELLKSGRINAMENKWPLNNNDWIYYTINWQYSRYLESELYLSREDAKEDCINYISNIKWKSNDLIQKIKDL